MTVEIWKQIPGYGGLYEVSNRGLVRSKTRTITRYHKNLGGMKDFVYKSRLLKLRKRVTGHLIFGGSYAGERFELFAHRAVLMAFVGLPEPGQEGCHNNGNASDNRVENLRWDTHANNMKDKSLHRNRNRGQTHPFAKITEAQAMQIIEGQISVADASKEFGISKSNASSIKRGATWKRTHQKLKGIL